MCKQKESPLFCLFSWRLEDFFFSRSYVSRESLFVQCRCVSEGHFFMSQEIASIWWIFCHFLKNIVEFCRIIVLNCEKQKKTLSIFCFTRKIFCESVIAIAFLLYHKGMILQNSIALFYSVQKLRKSILFYSLTFLTIFSFF